MKRKREGGGERNPGDPPCGGMRAAVARHRGGPGMLRGTEKATGSVVRPTSASSGLDSSPRNGRISGPCSSTLSGTPGLKISI